MNIVYITNENPKFVQFVNNSIESIKLHNANCDFYVIVCGTNYIKELDHSGIKQIHYDYKNTILYSLKNKENDRHALITYTKLFIHEILTDLDKCLFVDSDTICFGNIEHLYNTEVEYIGCRYDNCDSIYEKSKLKQDFYKDYNASIDRHLMSTIMLMNLKNLRKINFTEIVFKNYIQIYEDYMKRLSEQDSKFWQNNWFHEEMYLTINFFDKIDFICQDETDFMQLTPMKCLINVSSEFSKFLKRFNVRSVKNKECLTNIKVSFIHLCGLSVPQASTTFLNLSRYVSNARK